MNKNFHLAIQFVTNELKGFYDRGGSFKALNQKGRSEKLNVFSDSFDWKANLKLASKDFHAFDSLKRYCAHLIRTEKIIPVELLCSSFFNGEFIFGDGLTGELTFWYV